MYTFLLALTFLSVHAIISEGSAFYYQKIQGLNVSGCDYKNSNSYA